jgi:hypothetical protein
MLVKKRSLRDYENEIYFYLFLSGFVVFNGTNGLSGVWFDLDGVRFNCVQDQKNNYCVMRAANGKYPVYSYPVSCKPVERLLKFLSVCEKLKCFIRERISK